MALEGHSPIDYSKALASRTPALSNVVYLGTYESDFYGKLEIVDQDGKLMMRQGPKKSAYPLTHYDRDTFYYETAAESAVGLSGVTFVKAPDGKAATGVTVENLNHEGLGTFTRMAGKK